MRANPTSRISVTATKSSVVIDLPIDLMAWSFDMQFAGEFRIKSRRKFAEGLARYLGDIGHDDAPLTTMLDAIFEEMVSNDEPYTTEVAE